MVAGKKSWPAAFLEGFEAHLKTTKRDKAAVIAALVARKAASRQGVDKWFKTGQIRDANLAVVAEVLGVDYGELRLHARFVKPRPAAAASGGSASNRRLADRIAEAAAGYAVTGLPTGREIAKRWDHLPSPVQAFLLHQIDAYERLIETNGSLANLMFNAPAKPEYQEFEQTLAKGVRER